MLTHGFARLLFVCIALIMVIGESTGCGTGKHGAAAPVSAPPAAEGTDTPPEGVDVHDSSGKGAVLDEIRAAPIPEGVDPALWAQLTRTLAAFVRANQKCSAAVPLGDNGYVDDLQLIGGDVLAWSYRNTGDYDQNKLVGVTDLTPIGQYWDARAGDANWEQAKLADGDFNGLVSVSDITPIGQNFDNMVREYNVYASLDAADHPRNNGGDNGEENGPGALLVGSIELEDGVIPDAGGYRQFVYTLTNPGTDAYYWVRPTDGESEGWASNLVGGSLVELPILELTNPPSLGSGQAGDPYLVNDETDYVFALTDPVAGTVTHSELTEYVVSPARAGAIATADATLDINDGFVGAVTVTAWYGERPNRPDTTVHCEVIQAPGSEFRVVEVSPHSGGSGELTIFTAVVDGGNYALDQYEWDFGGGATPSTSTQREPLVVLEWVGTYEAQVTVTSHDGSMADTYEFGLTVIPTTDAPVIITLSPRYVESPAPALYVGSQVAQTAYCLATGMRPIDYSWNFAGGVDPNDFEDKWGPEHRQVEITPVDTWPEDPYVFEDALVNVENVYGDDGLQFDLIVEQPPRFFSGDGIEFWGEPGQQKVFTIGLYSGSYPLTFEWNYGGGAVPNTQPQYYQREEDLADTWPAILAETGKYEGTITVSNAYAEASCPFDLYVGVPKILSVAPTEGNEGQQLSFIANILGDHEEENLDPEYAWEFGASAIPSTSSEQSPLVVFGEHGEQPGMLTFSNKYGQDTLGFTVEVNGAPQAQLVAEPAQGLIPLSVEFDAGTSTDPEGGPLSYQWDWDGDGTFDNNSGDDPTVEHTYDTEGDFQATVRVVDEQGADDLASLTIKAEGEAPPLPDQVIISSHAIQIVNAEGGSGPSGDVFVESIPTDTASLVANATTELISCGIGGTFNGVPFGPMDYPDLPEGFDSETYSDIHEAVAEFIQWELWHDGDDNFRRTSDLFDLSGGGSFPLIGESFGPATVFPDDDPESTGSLAEGFLVATVPADWEVDYPEIPDVDLRVLLSLFVSVIIDVTEDPAAPEIVTAAPPELQLFPSTPAMLEFNWGTGGAPADLGLTALELWDVAYDARPGELPSCATSFTYVDRSPGSGEFTIQDSAGPAEAVALATVPSSWLDPDHEYAFRLHCDSWSSINKPGEWLYTLPAPPPQNFITFPEHADPDIDELAILYQDPVVRRDGRVFYDLFPGDFLFQDEEGFDDILKINGDEFILQARHMQLFPRVTVIEGTDPSLINPQTEGIVGVVPSERNPHHIILDIGFISYPGGVGDPTREYAYKVFMADDTVLGIGTFDVSPIGLSVDPPTGYNWGVNAFDREERDLSERGYSNAVVYGSTVGGTTPDVLWVEFYGGHIFWPSSESDLEAPNVRVRLTDAVDEGYMEIPLLMRIAGLGAQGSVICIHPFVNEDFANPGYPGWPGILDDACTYEVALDDPHWPGIEHEFSETLSVNGNPNTM